jgi:hypothetical protein
MNFIELILEVCGRIRSGTYSSATISSLPQPEIQCHHISPQRLIAHKSELITELIATHTPYYQPLHHLLSICTTKNTLICPKHHTQTPQLSRTLMYLQHRKIRRIMYVQRSTEARSRKPLILWKTNKYYTFFRFMVLCIVFYICM